MPNFTLKQLNDLTLAIESDFQVRYNEVAQNENWFPRLSFQRRTNKMLLTQQWIHDHAQIQEVQFGQPPNYHQMNGEYAQIPLKIYEDALRVNAYDISEDDFGQILQAASQLGADAAQFPQILAATALINGDTSDDYLMYDGQRMFANAHPKGGTTFDNLMAGAFDATNFNAVRTAMRRFPSDLGATRPYGIKPNYVIAPPDLEITIRNVLRNAWIASGGVAVDNLNNGLAEPIIEEQLTDTNDWYVASTELGVAPFVDVRHSDYGDFTLHAETSDDSPAFRDHHERRWWMRAIMTVFFTKPETMIKVVN